MSQDSWQVLDELDAKPPGAERVEAARSALVAVVTGLMPDPERRVMLRCVQIIREGYMDGLRVDERGRA